MDEEDKISRGRGQGGGLLALRLGPATACWTVSCQADRASEPGWLVRRETKLVCW